MVESWLLFCEIQQRALLPIDKDDMETNIFILDQWVKGLHMATPIHLETIDPVNWTKRFDRMVRQLLSIGNCEHILWIRIP